MPFKDVNKRREYRRKWYNENKTSEKKHVKRRKLEIRKWFELYKTGLKCENCSESHPATIDFHHNQGKKEMAISYMVGNGYSIEQIKKELKKCQVLCSNCHRKIHYKTAYFKTLNNT